MCGILLTQGLDQAFHHSQLASLRRRGPDALGFWAEKGLHLAHARLSIIGLEPGSTQPLANDSHVLAFNGEIYNFQELRDQLTARGVQFHTSSDSEVLLHGWSLWGRDMLARMHGFWAFAIADRRTRRVSLVRDQLGIKPLYYWHAPGMLCAASLLRTVVETVGGSPDLDYEALSEYVRYQFTFDDKTFFRQVRKVLPGHCVEIDLGSGELRDQVYEDIFRPPEGERQTATPALIETTTELIDRCCHASTISDTSFTTFCSGGIDSSLITSVVRPEIAYHGNFSDPDCNETAFALQVTEALPTRLMVVNAQESFDLLDRLSSLLEDFDEPSIGSVIFPLDDVLAQVKRRYKVILTGTGGDELFAGYVRYQLALGECYQDSYRALFERLRRLPSPAARFEFTHRKGNPALYRFCDRTPERTFAERFADCGSDPLTAMLTFDRRYFLAGLLNIDDKLCGRHSLEGRPSLLHQELVRHVMGIAPESLLHQKQLKYFLRQAAARHLPEAVLRRSDKMGFTTPIGTFINRSAHRIREQIHHSRFRHLYDLDQAKFTADNKFSRECFGLLLLDLWLNRYAAGSGRPAA